MVVYFHRHLSERMLFVTSDFDQPNENVKHCRINRMKFLFSLLVLSAVISLSLSFRGLRVGPSVSHSFLTASSALQIPSRSRSTGRDFSQSSQDSKPYSKISSDKPIRRDGGGFRGRIGGRSNTNRNRPSDSFQKLKFSTTVKIDPEFRSSIDEMDFSPATLKVLKEKGFTELTPVQSQSFEYVRSGGDVVARSRTGTGKTLAFGIPIIEKLVAEKKHLVKGGASLPLVLILEPTRELAMQVAQELGNLAAAHGMRVAAIYGGVSMYNQERDLRYGAHIVVATPGRALDHIGRGTMDLGNVEHVVLDEGDTMLEMGFQADVESIIANVKTPGKAARAAATRALAAHDDDDFDALLEDEDDTDLQETMEAFVDSAKARKVQVLLYSATMPGWIVQLTNKHMRTPVFLDAVQEGENRLAHTIKHYAIRLPRSEDRIRAISSSVEDLILTHGGGRQTIVFTNTKDEADNIAASDSFSQLRAQVLHGDISQYARQVTIKQFKEGVIDVLVATDVAARGLDIAGVDLVVHAAPPNDHDTYVHRSGRTGRAGRNGTSVMLYTMAGDVRRLEDFERQLNFRFEKTSPPSPADVARASAWYAAKKLEKVDSAAVNYFLPHAKNIVQTVLAVDNEEFVLPSTPTFPDNEVDSESGYSTEQVSQLLARCLAALSNKQTIQSR
jgi:ATP-dependent RNA helicase DDX21